MAYFYVTFLFNAVLFLLFIETTLCFFFNRRRPIVFLFQKLESEIIIFKVLAIHYNSTIFFFNEATNNSYGNSRGVIHLSIYILNNA